MSVIFSAVIKRLLKQKKKDDSSSATADHEKTIRDPREVLPQKTLVPDRVDADPDHDVK